MTIADPIIVGSVFTVAGQSYECVGFREYINRRGFPSTLVVVRSHCAECGAVFEFERTKTRIIRYSDVNRRCAAHKQPGVRVAHAPAPAA